MSLQLSNSVYTEVMRQRARAAMQIAEDVEFIKAINESKPDVMSGWEAPSIKESLDHLIKHHKPSEILIGMFDILRNRYYAENREIFFSHDTAPDTALTVLWETAMAVRKLSD